MLEVKKVAHLTGHRGALYAMSPVSEYGFFSAGSDGGIVYWDLREPSLGKLRAKLGTHLQQGRIHIFSIFYIKDKNMCVAGDMEGGVHFIDLSEPEKTKSIAHHRKSVFQIEWINHELCTVGADGVLTYWDVEQRRTVESIHLSAQSLRCVAFNPSTRETAIGSSDGNIYLLDKDKHLQKIIYQAHKSSVFTLAFSPDGAYLLSGGRDAMLNVRSTSDYERVLSSQPAHWFTINKILFHPQGHWFATASRDKTIKIWETGAWKLLKVIDTIRYGCHIHSINNLLWMNHQLISASDDSSLMVWAIH